MNIRVAIFDDNKNLLDSLFQLINGSSGFECVGAFPNCNELTSDIKKSKPDVVVFNYWLPLMAPCYGTIARILRKEKSIACLAVIRVALGMGC